MIDEYQYFNEMKAVLVESVNILIEVYSGEGLIPHFHFYKHISSNQKTSRSSYDRGGCICIKGPYYFLHGKHDETLTSKEMKEVIKALKKPYKKNADESGWERIIEIWNEFNPNNKVPINLEIPDYRYDMDSINDKREISYFDFMNLEIDEDFIGD